VLSREAANINLIVLGLRSLGSNPRSIYHTGEHANHYTNDAVFLLHHALFGYINHKKIKGKECIHVTRFHVLNGKLHHLDIYIMVGNQHVITLLPTPPRGTNVINSGLPHYLHAWDTSVDFIHRYLSSENFKFN
jgi:hypothetical protein